MFGRNRRLATEHTIDAIRPLLGVLQHFHGTPAGFWRDEFVLGFFGFMISFHVKYTCGRTLSAADKGYLLADVFTALSNQNGVAITREYTRLATSVNKSLDFEQGADNAAICAFATMGKVTEKGMPHYEAAKEIAHKHGKGSDIAAVAAILTQELFYAVVRDRFV